MATNERAPEHARRAPRPDSAVERARLDVRGTVQGVGFRPFVAGLARALGLAGFVQNTSSGVSIEVQGSAARIAAFARRLAADAPPGAGIESIATTRSPARALPHQEPTTTSAFVIRPSALGDATTAVALPDLATCPACMAEIRDPGDRRHRYPFTSCTGCGPRFSIIRALPYDRERTTMAGFAMCAPCRAEYEDPANRRFHAQTIACRACGPTLSWWDCSGAELARGDHALDCAGQALAQGRIVAVKGLGGFQLMVDARDGAAVARLRARKRRPHKPFALLFASLAELRVHCEVSQKEAALLESSAAPIVLVRRATPTGAGILADDAAGEAAPDGFSPDFWPNYGPDLWPNPWPNPFIGAMLPCTPLHALLAGSAAGPLVATSGNISGEPLCTDEHEALRRLAGIADYFLVHDRAIARPLDDSVARIMAGRPMLIRRARGHAPLSMLQRSSDARTETLPPILAMGGHMKSAIAYTCGESAVLGAHIGDLDTAEAADAFYRTIGHTRTLHTFTPRVIACDSHPEYHSTRAAHALAGELGAEVFPVQHHHAHVRACMADNGVDAPVLGVAWDGTGHGADGTIWGGEFLLVGATAGAERLAHLRTFCLPGGDAAAREPRRAALGVLYEIHGPDLDQFADLAAVAAFGAHERAILLQAMERGVNAPRTSSAGRLFDAVAALAGLVQRCTFEGQAAMALEHAADPGIEDAYPFAWHEPATGPRIVDWAPLIAALIMDLRARQPASAMAARFHNALVAIIVAAAMRTGHTRIALTGGCFQNRLLTERAIAALRAAGCEPYWHARVPPNDGGLAFGQLMAALQAARLQTEQRRSIDVPGRARTDH
jgi:hydrogenase maturation protein HypF